MFRKRVKTRLRASLEDAGVDLSISLGSTILDMMIDNELSDYSLVLDMPKANNGFIYNFDTEDWEEWVGCVELGINGDCFISVRGVNRSGNPPEWDNAEINSEYDLFGKPLEDV